MGVAVMWYRNKEIEGPTNMYGSFLGTIISRNMIFEVMFG
jgi:hypothetical protein